MQLSIIIPAYNEEGGLGSVLDHLVSIVTEHLPDTEIIVVDDGSQDGTAAIAAGYANITVLSHPTNRGYGAALKTGIRHAQSDLICITDADGTYPNERIPDLLAQLQAEKYDMVVGARTGANVAIPLVRRPAKWVIRQLASYVASEPIPDLNSGLRLFRRDVALRFFNILPDGFSFTTTITLGMLSNNYMVYYLPIDYHARVGNSKIKPIRDTLNFTQLVLRIGLYFDPLKVFVPLSLLLLLLSVAWALFTKIAFGQLADVSALVIAMAALQVFVVGLLAELINQRLPNLKE